MALKHQRLKVGDIVTWIPNAIAEGPMVDSGHHLVAKHPVMQVIEFMTNSYVIVADLHTGEVITRTSHAGRNDHWHTGFFTKNKFLKAVHKALEKHATPSR